MVLRSVSVEHFKNSISFFCRNSKNKTNTHIESIVDRVQICTTFNQFAKYWRYVPRITFDNRNQLLFTIFSLRIHTRNIFVESTASYVNHTVNCLAIFSKNFHNRLYINASWCKKNFTNFFTSIFSINNKWIIKILNKLTNQAETV